MIQARIYSPSKSAMQSGRAQSETWMLVYELPTSREPEPLMGWVASGDTLNQVRMTFKSLDEAKEFAQRQGFSYIVMPSQARHVRPRNYGDNFRYKGEA